MATVSWGAPTLQFMKLTSSMVRPDWESTTAEIIEVPGDILLENSSTLNTTEGDTKELRNEKGEAVDTKKLPSSYAFTSSVIRKKGEVSTSGWGKAKAAFAAVNGVVPGDWGMRLKPEDVGTVGFVFNKCTISLSKSWSAEQGALEVINVNGVVPNTTTTATSKEICEDYIES